MSLNNGSKKDENILLRNYYSKVFKKSLKSLTSVS